MSDKDKLISNEDGKGTPRPSSTPRSPWYCGVAFLLFWIILFFAIVIPLFYRLPPVLTVEDSGKGAFIGERAYKTLNELVQIGPRLTGSAANEVDAVSFLLLEINDIKKNLLEEYFNLDIDVQMTSGSHIYSSLLEMYEGVQNVVVKLSSKNSTSESYLLVNSHFDTVLTSPGAGDDGFMVATMLEILRVMATTKQHFEHPVVFLFNGDEEMGMQASHGFITQHKWAGNCKAVVNLEGAGGGGREILFQTGPSHPWLSRYYGKSAKHPLATTLAEEIFQAGLIDSATDYRIFVQYGDIPGLDFGQFINGYIYHTKYDRIDAIPRGAIQNTGDNILGLVRALANAPEMHDTYANREGHAVFFDFLGLFFVSYTEETGKTLNYGVSGLTLILIFISVWRMSAVSSLSSCHVVQRLIILMVIQILGFVLGLALPILVAYFFDSFGLSLTYFSSPYLLIGLYVCPSLIGLTLPITIYYQSQQKNKLPFVYHLQLGLHSWAIVLSLLVLGATTFGIRSVYGITISLAFYAISLAVNLLTTLHDRGYRWSGMFMSFQLIPFLYLSSLIYTFIVAMTPMNGRSGSASNPDTMIAALSALGTVLSLGFLAPVINMFRRPTFVVLTLVLASGITMYLAGSTQIGFPYRPKTNSERVMYQHVRRIFYEYDGTVSKDESGYLFNFQDRREERPFVGVNLTGSVRTRSECNKHMMCGMPLFDERWVHNRLQGMWLPRETIEPPFPTKLELISKKVMKNDSTIVRFKFRVTGPPHLSLFIEPYKDDFVTVSNWTFSQNYLKNPPASPLSYHIFITFGIANPTLDFTLDISKPNGDFEVPLFQLGVSGHYMGDKGDESSLKLASTFPSYAILVHWPSTYQRYIF
ncbi:endoplasmic reticulum metallopeptidase 1-like [Drosophila innubila]|uniref:endoplasmic reticulum metallopeptidase 1-like n=1 Tax=Drosophila innubila TaxID=198719 RepID=UPI00148DB23F|nr:endoplasmic reticulum metallopeptidase 1-like [Drosophila innubila]